MGKPNALARLVLASSPAEEFKNTLMILGVDAAAVIGDLEDRKAELGPAADRNPAGSLRLEVFDRIVDQVGEDLLQRQSVADDARQGLDVDLGVGFRGLMRQSGNNPLDQLVGVDRLR